MIERLRQQLQESSSAAGAREQRSQLMAYATLQPQSSAESAETAVTTREDALEAENGQLRALVSRSFAEIRRLAEPWFAQQQQDFGTGSEAAPSDAPLAVYDLAAIPIPWVVEPLAHDLDACLEAIAEQLSLSQ